jgi:hypothetical protein
MNYGETFAAVLILAVAVGCGGGSGSTTNPSGLSVILSSNTTSVYQNQSAATITVLLTRTGTTGNVTLTVQGAPPSVSTDIQSPNAGNSGTVRFTALPAPNPGSNPNLGSFTVTISASDGVVSGSATTPLTVGAYVNVTPTIDGPMQLAMSTSFQPAEWDYQLFQNLPAVAVPLSALNPSHIRLQPISQGVPQTGPTTWDFTVVDAITQPVLKAGDQKPEFQIAVAPTFMNGIATFDTDFATYASQLVRYYNKGGFDVAGTHYQSPSVDSISWWGVFNEPNYNNFDSVAYTQLYNTVVPAMQTVDPSIRFVAVELGDFPGEANTFLPAFVSGVTAQVDVLATHFYSTCNQKDSDQKLFNTVPGFASEVQDIYAQLRTNPALSTVPVWVTENNVNADFDKGGGMSACNSGQAFVRDQRGSSAFFAAWRPYVFSQLGKASAAALYQWVYAGDTQYGEIDDSTGNPRLSYWVDYWLQHKFPAPPGTALLQADATDDAELETLAAQNSDGSVVVMVANHALSATTDNNGPGAPRGVLIDVTQLPGPFQTAKVLTIDATTNLTNGPTETTVGLAAQIPVTLNGYGVAFLTLK